MTPAPGLENLEAWHPGLLVALFIGASLLMLWRLEQMTGRGVEGTVLGTLVMPYCSGIGNLMFVVVVVQSGEPGREVITNSLVNNVTNMTLLIGLPAMIWGINLGKPSQPAATRSASPASKPKRNRRRQRASAEPELQRLSLLLTLTAVLFFSGCLWALGRDGRLDFGDGLVLVGLFLFWQCFHIFEVLKQNVRENKSWSHRLWLDLALLGIGAYGVYVSIEALVAWLSEIDSGFISARQMGWLSGWLMVVPNGMLALYYGWRRRPEIIYSSQVGDGHICIPLCTGLIALFQPISAPGFFEWGLLLLAATTAVHMLCVGYWGKLPRIGGWLLGGIYGYFVYQGLAG